MMLDVSTWRFSEPNFQYFYRRGWKLLRMDGRLWLVKPPTARTRELFDQLRTPQV